MKRCFDFFCAGLGLIILSPLFAAIVAAIKLEDNGPVFYKAQRVGLNGTMLRLFKFRTMVVNADKIGAGITNASDRRITRIGGFLRRYKLDEFPQLINILRGEMSFVGPRPEDPRYINFYTEQQRMIFNVKPGITSPASLFFREEASLLVESEWEEMYIKEIIPKKLAIDIDYFEKNTFWSNCVIIFRTIMAIFC